jgi:hypothetical protein
MTTTSQPAGGFSTSVIDLLSLLTVAFLGLGIFLGALERRAQAPTSAPEDVRAALDAARAQERNLAAYLASLAEELARRAQALADAEAYGTSTLPADDTDTRAAQVAEQRQRLEEARRKLADLEAALAAAGKDKYTFDSGAPIVNAGRHAGESYIVVLSEGKVRVAQPPYYRSRTLVFDDKEWTPDGPAISLEEALQRDSVLMRDVTTAAFRENGRVVLLVMSDSFGAFRLLRDALARAGVDYGWEPITSPTFLTGPGGRAVESQAGR